MNEYLPNLDVAVLSSVLQYSRSLIEFYAPGQNPCSTDIVIDDFGTSVAASTRDSLRQYKPAIEVHLLHLTAWRDVDYRVLHAADARKMDLDYGAHRQRPDWNTEVPTIASKLAAACGEAATKASDWRVPFTRLAEAIRQLEQDPTAWPRELTEKVDVTQYLRGLGLAR